jgi:hypothetical protein
MKLQEFKHALSQVTDLVFKLENGVEVPLHFHITEIGLVSKKFIDCGGKLYEEQKINFQFWQSVDVWHRLQASKLLDIIALSEKTLALPDVDIDMEYETETVGRYGLVFQAQEKTFILTAIHAACLAQDKFQKNFYQGSACSLENPCDTSAQAIEKSGCKCKSSKIKTAQMSGFFIFNSATEKLGNRFQ